MEEQYGIWASREEWQAVLMAMSNGMRELFEQAKRTESEDDYKLAAIAHVGAQPVLQRVMRELGILDDYEAFARRKMKEKGEK